MVKYEIIFSRQANKDKKLLKQAGLEQKAKGLLEIIQSNPYQMPPLYEKLKGNLAGACSRRISLQHRLVYEVDEANKQIFVLRMWSHYEKMR